MGMLELQIAPPNPGAFHPPALPLATDLPHFTAAEAPLRFGDFTLYPRERVLFFQEAPVKLGSRAFDLLTKLASSDGKVVSKNELVEYVWPSTFVDDSNLRFQMASLRRALGNARDMIKTIPGRGYLFVNSTGSHSAPSRHQADIAPSTVTASARLSKVVPLVQAAKNDHGRRFTVVVVEGVGSLRELLGNVLQSLDHDLQGVC